MGVELIKIASISSCGWSEMGVILQYQFKSFVCGINN